MCFLSSERPNQPIAFTENLHLQDLMVIARFQTQHESAIFKYGIYSGKSVPNNNEAFYEKHPMKRD
jgi:hypothetical protein